MNQQLQIYACDASRSKGRLIKEVECEVRTVFQRDRDRILHAKAFRRLAHKTQVFIAPEGDHYRTRLTHTLEVAQIARTIARGLHLNEDLVEAIALGHDLGHTPFGHAGEYVLGKLTNGQFSHSEQSLRIVDKLEREGKGLNLTYEVRDGILNHQSKSHPSTLEGKVVQLSDKIAYVNHDIDDALRGKVLKDEDLPNDCVEILGNTSSKRINTLITNIIYESKDKNTLVMGTDISEAFYKMRHFLFQHVYIGSVAKTQEEKAKSMIEALFQYYKRYPELLPAKYVEQMKIGDTETRVICDYIAGMTDRYAISHYCELFFPASWKIY